MNKAVKNKRGYLLAIVGLLLGMAGGFGVLAAKRIAATELVQLLADEAATACECEFKVDSIEVSLLTLKARAVNPRIESQGKVMLGFESLTAWFDISQVFSRTVHISDMLLQKGSAIGVTEQSVLYKFVDQLTTPIPPERDRPDRWRIKLMQLEIAEGSVTERIGQAQVTADQVELRVQRTPENDFRITGTVKQVELQLPKAIGADEPRKIGFGGVQASVLLLDDKTVYESVRLEQLESWLQLAWTAEKGGDGNLTGDLGYRVTTAQTFAAPYLDIFLVGDGQAAGTMDAPVVAGSFSLEPESTGKLILNDSTNFELTALAGSYQVAIDQGLGDHGVGQLLVPKLVAWSRDAQLEVVSPITVSESELSGKLRLNATTLAVNPLELQGAVIDLSLSGTAAQPQLSLAGAIELLKIPGAPILQNSKISSILDVAGLEISIESAPAQGGHLRAKSKLQFADDAQFSSVNSEITFADYPVAPLGELTIDGQLRLAGSLELTALAGDGEILVLRRNIPVASGSISLAGGELALAVASASNKALMDAKVDFGSSLAGRVDVKLAGFSIDEIDEEVACSNLDLAVNYQFSLQAPMEGSGQIDLGRIELGCAPYLLNLTAGMKLPIVDGGINLKQVKVQSSEIVADGKSLELDGRISLKEGFDLALGGDLYLQSLVGLARGIDNLLGKASVNLTIQGDLGSPSFAGVVDLVGGEVFIEADAIEAREVNGRVQLDHGKITFEQFGGLLNGGVFTLSGEIYPNNLAISTLQLQFKRALLEPVESAIVEVSGSLKLSAGRDARSLPLIEGAVTIDGAEFSKDIDLRFIVQFILSRIFLSGPRNNFSGEVPEIELDMSISAPRNILISTNLAVVELSGELEVGGTMAVPAISGEIRTLSGWFKIKDRRLEITSGVLTFNPGSLDPAINLLGETYVTSIYGQSALVLVELRGPISNPTLTLSSDIGLSQREIIDLLAHQGTISDLMLANAERRSLLAELEDPDSEFFNENIITLLPRLLRDLARLDSLSVEPTYSPARASIDPTIVAARKITNRVDLRGESAFSGAGTDASLGIFYQLTQGVTLSGKIESSYDQDLTALSADLIYSAYGRNRPFLETRIVGNDNVDDLTLMHGIRLRDNSRLLMADIAGVGQAAVNFYNRRGFFSAQAEAECLEFRDYCRALLLTVQEGEASYVVETKVSIDKRGLFNNKPPSSATSAAAEVIRKFIQSLPDDRQATAKYLEQTAASLVRALRNEGYIGARVEVAYIEPTKSAGNYSPSDRVLGIEVAPGRPITLVFEGNTVFGPEDFLDTINFFERKQPFGNNTINILAENILRLYRQSGYSQVEVEWSQQMSELEDRVIYLIDIKEGEQINIKGIGVSFTGVVGPELSERRLKDSIKERFPERSRRFLNPRYFVPEENSDHIAMLTATLIALGYPNPQVAVELKPTSGGGVADVELVYIIVPGDRIVVNALTITGLPNDLAVAGLPEQPVFIPALNEYIASVYQALRVAGYQKPAIVSEVISSVVVNSEAAQTIELVVDPGPAAVIGAIQVDGLRKISLQLVQSMLQFESGDYWNQDKIDASKRALLKSGLFSQVQIESATGSLAAGAHDMTIRVVERPLQNVEVGGGLHSEYGFHLFTQATDRGLFKDGRSLSLRLDGYYDPVEQDVPYGVAGIQYVDPAAFDSDYSFASDLRFQKIQLRTQEYDLDRVSLASYFNRSFDSPWTAAFGHTVMYDDLDDVTPGAVISDLDTGDLYTSFLSGRLSYDRRNSKLNPSSGYFLGVDSKLASELIASDANFFEAGARAAYIHPIVYGERYFSFASHLRALSSWHYGDTEEIPITQRFYLGGRTTVRGFRENSLGPRGADGAVIGGDLSLLGNFEFRYHPLDAIQVLTFIDSGTVFLQDRSTDLGELRYSSGVGVRYLSPIGPIGIDLGVPLDEKPGEPSMRVHFTVGTQF